MKYLGIEEQNIENGPGLRTVLWVSGCSIHCPGCHNPESWDFNNGKDFGDDQINYILKTLESNYIAGLTISGGNPFEPFNYQELTKLCQEVKKLFPTKTIWVYTGYQLNPKIFTTPIQVQTIEDLEYNNIHDILQLVDVVVDGPYEEKLRDITLAFRGSSNQRVIDCKKTIQTGEIVLYS